MDIEVLEQTETTVNGFEDVKQAKLLSEELGLTPGSRQRFAVMKSSEYWAYSLLMSNKDSYTDFESEYVPLRILELIKREKDNYKLEIWSVPNHVVKDPILVGVIEKDKYTKLYYLLARWGDALMPFETLYKKAVAIHKNKVVGDLRKAQGQIRVLLENLDSLTDSQIQGLTLSCWIGGY